MAPDLTSSPCVGKGGVPVTADHKVYACTGTFGGMGPKPKDLCNSGYHLCMAMDGPELQQVDDAKCKAPDGSNGFYTVQITAQLKMPMGKTSVMCPKDMNPDSLVGCGSQSGTQAVMMGDCMGLKSLFHCGDPSAAWSCMSELKDAKQSSTVGGGVLCCAD